MERLHAFAVMPCYNEQDILQDTCMSLGFGTGIKPPAGAHLILVNNNSVDNTQLIAEKITAASGSKNVTVCFEAESGFVPARRKGNEVVSDICNQRGLPMEDVVVLQVDADTIYGEQYVNFIQKAFMHVPSNTIVQATIDYPDLLKRKYKFFFDSMYEIDDEYSFLYKLDSSNDVLIDDKIASYRLSDYYSWGCHQREYSPEGEEILAETTRLFLRAKALGAKRIDLAGATAIHSGRRIEEHPLLSFAAGGFPRETNWQKKWTERMGKYHDELGIQKMISKIPEEVVYQRELHILALLYVLPMHVQRALGSVTNCQSEIDQFTMSHLPLKSRRYLEEHPGSFLIDVFNLIDDHGNELLSLAKKAQKIYLA